DRPRPVRQARADPAGRAGVNGLPYRQSGPASARPWMAGPGAPQAGCAAMDGKLAHLFRAEAGISMTILRMTDLDLSGKRVLIRQGLSVPTDCAHVTSEPRTDRHGGAGREELEAGG